MPPEVANVFVRTTSCVREGDGWPPDRTDESTHDRIGVLHYCQECRDAGGDWFNVIRSPGETNFQFEQRLVLLRQWQHLHDVKLDQPVASGQSHDQVAGALRVARVRSADDPEAGNFLELSWAERLRQRGGFSFGGPAQREFFQHQCPRPEFDPGLVICQHYRLRGSLVVTRRSVSAGLVLGNGNTSSNIYAFGPTKREGAKLDGCTQV